MKHALIFCLFFTIANICLAQQADSSKDDFQVFYSNDILQIKPAKYYAVAEYEVSILKHSGDMIGPYLYKWGRPSKEAIDVVKNAHPGDKIYFEEIRICKITPWKPMSTNTVTRAVNSIIYNVP